MGYHKLSVLVPVYNEEATLVHILDAILEVNLPQQMELEVVVVDDCSTDACVALLQSYMQNHAEQQFRFASHPVNQGKGAALHTAIEMASGDLIIVQDADLEYNPQDFFLLLDPILNGRADVVYGSRFLGKAQQHSMKFWQSFGNRFLTFLSNRFTGLHLTDMETCYKMMRADVLKGLSLTEKKFGFEPEVTHKLAKIPGIRICEVAISYEGRSFSEGKKIGLKDGIRAIYCILRYGI